MPRAFSFILVLFVLSTLASAAAENVVRIKVEAGAQERKGTPVSFELPENVGAGPFVLLDEAGKELPFQVNKKREGTFILPALAKDATAVFTLKTVAKETLAVTVRNEKGELKFKVADKDVLSFQDTPKDPPEGARPVFKRGGYIFPLYTPTGVQILNDAPADHYHHHGIWTAWTKTQFQDRTPDFWNVGDLSARIEPAGVAAETMYEGSVYAGLTNKLNFIDIKAQPNPITVLHQTWDFKLYHLGEQNGTYRMLDLVLKDTCATDAPLKLPKYHYGGLGVRGSAQWEKGSDKCVFLTSEGKTRADGNETTGRWCHIGGKVDEKLAGCAILGHPTNFRAPQGMRLNPKEPFFCFCPSQGGEWEITPEKPYEARYRIVVYDGPANADEINRLWNDYAQPPKVTVTVETK